MKRRDSIAEENDDKKERTGDDDNGIEEHHPGHAHDHKHSKDVTIMTNGLRIIS